MDTTGSTPCEDRLLSEGEVSRFLMVPCATLRRWRVERVNLPFVHVGRAVRYRRQDLDRFVADNVQKIARRG